MLHPSTAPAHRCLRQRILDLTPHKQGARACPNTCVQLHAACLEADVDVDCSVISLPSSSCSLDEPPLSAWKCCPVAEVLRLWTRSRDASIQSQPCVPVPSGFNVGGLAWQRVKD